MPTTGARAIDDFRPQAAVALGRATVAGALLFFAVAQSRADDGPFSSIYHSLDQWSRNARQQLQDEPTPTPSHTGSHRHQSTTKRHVSPSPSPSASPLRKTRQNEDEDDENPNPPRKKHAVKAQPSPSSSSVGEDDVKTNPSPNENRPPSVATLDTNQLKDFESQPRRVQDLIRSALTLTQKNLTYIYGSADPGIGGMDCSGFIYYILTNAGFKDVPRQSSDQYLWVRKNGDFHAVLSRNADTFELDQLRPGDLMFWSGTYKVDRDVPVTHVMVYLGKQKSNGKPVMVGASDGRSYDGIRRFGVSVFDFKLPNGTPNKNDPDLVSRFEGYSSIPGLRESIYRVQAAIPTPSPSPPLKRKTPPHPEILSNGD
jgi:cell wall-associated NlpC family hydrolase